jgi:hypothetical protein
MVVRIRFPRGSRKGNKVPSRHAPFVSVFGGLMMLVAISCLGLSMWRLTSDLAWTGTFAITDGLLSHWQVWLALAVVFGGVALRLMRLGRPPEPPPQKPAEPKVGNTAVTR